MQKTAISIKPQELVQSVDYYEEQGHNTVSAVKLAVEDSLEKIGY